jgi:cellulose synthase operon protein C
MFGAMRRRPSAVIFFLVGLTLMPGARAQSEPGTTPLMAGASSAVREGDTIATEGAARRAMEMGFSSVAVGLWRDLVATTSDVQERDARLLSLVIAQIEADDLAGAQASLAELSNADTAPAQLRRGLIAAASDNFALANESLAGVQRDSLPESEIPWYHYLAGALADQRGDPAAAQENFSAAIAASTSSLQRARFELADLRSQWRESAPTEAQLGQLQQRMQSYAGEPVGFDAAKRYAAVLASLGREVEAVTFLQNQLLILPPGERVLRDDLRLLLGVIAGATEGLGRNALLRLLQEGESRSKQRIALRMLAQGSTTADTRDELSRQLDQLLGAGAQHPIEQDLILFRAQLATDADAATRDALALLERFPASDLRTAALGILVNAAWEDGRYRAAAGYAAQARRELVEGDPAIRAELGVLQAEAFFRGGDFSSAADAYAASLDEPLAGVAAGDLVFQEILARVLDGQLEAAASRIDGLADDVRLDLQNRWQAEWNLARALQANGREAEAYARVNRVMAEHDQAAELPPELAVRMAWLQARLALDAGEPERALELAPALLSQLSAVEARLADEVASSVRLLEAEAHFALGQSEQALAVLQQLREAYPDADAAVYSFIEEAGAEAAQGQLVKAQQLLAELILKYPENRYAPYALYQSALLAESRREDAYLREAVTKVEQLVTDYPTSPLVFYARFKQGDLLRQMGQWEPARQVYELIIRDFPRHQDVWAAQMALADSLSAQAGTDSSLQDSASAIYERMRDVASAPIELRVEAGFKAGNALARRGRWDRAAETWWQVVDEFLVQNENPERLGTRGRYWLARICAQLGEVMEQQANYAEARRAYQMVLQWGLPEQEWARAQLRRLGETAAPSEGTGVDA